MTYFFLFLAFNSLNIQLSSASIETKDPSFVIQRHIRTLKNIQISPPSLTREALKDLIQKLSKGKMTPQMIEYFSGNPLAVSVLQRASLRAESLSKSVCGIKKGEARRRDDEVDAVRHFIWTVYLGLELRERTVLEIQSMQENRQIDLNEANIMDLYNNGIGIKYLKEIKSTYAYHDDRNRDNLLEMYITNRVIQELKNDRFYILKSLPSKCQKIRQSNLN